MFKVWRKADQHLKEAAQMKEKIWRLSSDLLASVSREVSDHFLNSGFRPFVQEGDWGASGKS